MSEGHASAQRINQSLTGDPLLLHRVDSSQLQAPVHVVNGYAEEHPADENQGRGMDPASHRRGLFSPIVDACMYCVIRAAEALMSDQDAQPAKPLKAKPLPDLEHREAASFFEGWWAGICVGAVIGAGLMAVILPVLGAA